MRKVKKMEFLVVFFAILAFNLFAEEPAVSYIATSPLPNNLRSNSDTTINLYIHRFDELGYNFYFVFPNRGSVLKLIYVDTIHDAETNMEVPLLRLEYVGTFDRLPRGSNDIAVVGLKEHRINQREGFNIATIVFYRQEFKKAFDALIIYAGL
jgi:hypothetical protein